MKYFSGIVFGGVVTLMWEISRKERGGGAQGNFK